MTGKIEALKALLAKVEAGDFPALHRDVSAAGLAHNSYGRDCSGHAWDAFNGSLDAAKALHDAVLPGWDWNVTAGSASVFKTLHPHDGNIHDGAAGDNPARAWLIAILRALIAQGGDQ